MDWMSVALQSMQKVIDDANRRSEMVEAARLSMPKDEFDAWLEKLEQKEERQAQRRHEQGIADQQAAAIRSSRSSGFFGFMLGLICGSSGK